MQQQGPARRGVTRASRTLLVAAAGAGIFVAASACTTSSGPFDTGTTTRVSVSSAGKQTVACNQPFWPSAANLSISASGRYVAFLSSCPKLVSNDVNGSYPDVFVRDRTANTTKLVSVDTTGQPAPAPTGGGEDYFASAPLLSSDGTHIAYVFRAGQSHSYDLLFLRDLRTGAVSEIPTSESFTSLLAISADGRYVLHQSTSSYVGGASVDLYDATTKKDTHVFGHFGDWADDPGSGTVAVGSVSANGRYVAFDVTGDPTTPDGVYRRDQTTGRTALVARGASAPSMSADGRYVAFQSTAANLVAGDTNGVSDVFRRDMTTGRVVRVSVSATGAQANGSSYPQSISANGDFVGFTSAATNLVPGDTNAHTDMFVRQLSSGSTHRVSLTSSGGQANRGVSDPVLSADGLHAAFVSAATNLVPGDTNNQPDAFVRDAQPAH